MKTEKILTSGMCALLMATACIASEKEEGQKERRPMRSMSQDATLSLMVGTTRIYETNNGEIIIRCPSYDIRGKTTELAVSAMTKSMKRIEFNQVIVAGCDYMEIGKRINAFKAQHDISDSDLKVNAYLLVQSTPVSPLHAPTHGSIGWFCPIKGRDHQSPVN